MPATTSNLALPYPLAADTADVPRDIQALAVKLDASGGVGTTLPASPTNGQEYFYVADATNGIVWHLRYRTASASAYKWEVVGGPALFDEQTANDSVNVNTYTVLPSAGPNIALPLAGDYLIEIGCRAWANTISRSQFMSYQIGATAAADTDGLEIYGAQTLDSVNATYGAPFARKRRKNALTAVTLSARYKTGIPNVANFQNRWMAATPIRVG